MKNLFHKNLDRYRNLVTIPLILIGLISSCSTKVENKKDSSNCTINTDTLRQFLFEERNTVIELFGENRIPKENECYDFRTFINNYQTDKKRKQIYNDTLIQFLGLSVFDEFIEKKENKRYAIARLQKSNDNQILLIEGKQRPEGVVMWTYDIEFDKNCIYPTKEKSGGKLFTRDCFNLLKSSKKNVSKKDWREFYEIISETDLLNTVYTEDNRSFCHGDSYFLEYFPGFSNYYINRKYEYDCPNTKSGIFLVSEKLIQLSRGVDYH